MTITARERARERAARLAGAMFLFINATGIFSEIFVRGSLLSGDITQVAQNIIDSERMYRLSIVADLAMLTGVVVLIWTLYVLLRPVNRDLALLAVLLRIVETAVSVTAIVASLIAVRLLSSTQYLEAFETGELHALSRVATNTFGFGQDVGFIFLGLGSTIFAYLLLMSRYIPRVLAGWGVFASLLFTIYNLVIIIFPSATKLMLASLAPMGIYEITIGVWLLLKGVNLSRKPV